MFTVSNVLIKQGRYGLYFIDGSGNAFSVDLSFCEIPHGFQVDNSPCTIEGKLTKPLRDNLLAHFIVKTIVV